MSNGCPTGDEGSSRAPCGRTLLPIRVRGLGQDGAAPWALLLTDTTAEWTQNENNTVHGSGRA
jgi:hypothetical protein